MKNKKGQEAREFLMTYGWVILPIIMIMVILGMGYYSDKKNAEVNPEFTIYTDELIVHTEVYKYCIAFCEEHKNSTGCIKYPCSNLIQRKEVDNIYYIGGKELLKLNKESLTTEWLDEFCECVEFCNDGPKFCVLNSSSIQQIEDFDCFRYKCEDYEIEVK